MLGNFANKLFSRHEAAGIEPPPPPPSLHTIDLENASPWDLAHAREDAVVSEVKKLIAGDRTVNAPWGRGGETALHRVCSVGNLEAARLLLEAGANVDVRDSRGYTPFMFAAASLNPDLLQFLLHNGANAAARAKGYDSEQQKPGDSALDYLLHSTRYEAREAPDYIQRETACVKMLLDQGLELGDAWSKSIAYGRPNLTAFFPELAAAHDFDKVAKSQDLAALKEKLDAGTDPDLSARYGDQSALCFAAEKNNIPMIEMLIKAGASMNTESTYRTPLHAAVLAGAREAVTALIQAGADPDHLYTSDRYPDTTLPELAESCKTDPGLRKFVEAEMAKRPAAPPAPAEKRAAPPPAARPSMTLQFRL